MQNVLFKERGEVLDLSWCSVWSAGYLEAPQMQGPDLRHPLVEGQARARHGQDQDTAAWEGSRGPRNKAHPDQVRSALLLILFNSVLSYESTRLHRVFAMRSSEELNWSNWIVRFAKTEACPFQRSVIVFDYLRTRLISNEIIPSREQFDDNSFPFDWFYFFSIKTGRIRKF